MVQPGAVRSLNRPSEYTKAEAGYPKLDVAVATLATHFNPHHSHGDSKAAAVLGISVLSHLLWHNAGKSQLG
jgi:hypothetical protein